MMRLRKTCPSFSLSPTIFGSPFFKLRLKLIRKGVVSSLAMLNMFVMTSLTSTSSHSKITGLANASKSFISLLALWLFRKIIWRFSFTWGSGFKFSMQNWEHELITARGFFNSCARPAESCPKEKSLSDRIMISAHFFSSVMSINEAIMQTGLPATSFTMLAETWTSNFEPFFLMAVISPIHPPSSRKALSNASTFISSCMNAVTGLPRSSFLFSYAHSLRKESFILVSFPLRSKKATALIDDSMADSIIFNSSNAFLRSDISRAMLSVAEAPSHSVHTEFDSTHKASPSFFNTLKV